MDANRMMSSILLLSFYLVFIILLLNFLIAILSGIYETIQQDSKRKFKKIFIETLISVEESYYPPPLNLLEPFVLLYERFMHVRLQRWPSSGLGYEALARLWGNAEGDLYDLDPRSPYWPQMSKLWTPEMRTKQAIFPFMLEAFCFMLAKMIVYLYALVWPLTIVGTIHYFADGDSFENSKLVIFYVFYQLLWHLTLLPWILLFSLSECLSSIATCCCCGFSAPTTSTEAMSSLSELSSLRSKNPAPATEHHKKLFSNITTDSVTLMKKIQSVYHSSQISRVTKQKLCLLNENQKVSMTKDGSFISCRTTESLCVVGNYSWSSSDIIDYFEVEVIIPGIITLGVVQKPHVSSHHPGWFFPSAGFHCDDGQIYPADKEKDEKNPWNEHGAVAGCGIDYQKKIIFFTLNGVLLPEYFNLPLNVVFYPAVSLRHRGSSAAVNFGRHPFRFSPRGTVAVDFKNKLQEPRINLCELNQTRLFASYCNPAMKRSDLGISETLLAVRPWMLHEPRMHYFEAEIINFGATRQIAVGVASRDYCPHEKVGMATFSLSMWIDGRGGTIDIYANTSDRDIPTFVGSTMTPPLPYGSSLQLGVGIDTISQKVFFVANGRILHKHSQTIDTSAIAELYPAITLDSHGQCVSLNFDIVPPDMRGYEETQVDEETTVYEGFGHGVGSFVGSQSDLMSEQRSIVEAAAAQVNEDSKHPQNDSFAHIQVEVGDDDADLFSASTMNLAVEQFPDHEIPEADYPESNTAPILDKSSKSGSKSAVAAKGTNNDRDDDVLDL